MVLALALALACVDAHALTPRTVADVVARHGPAAEQRLLPYFRAAGIPYPPRSISLVGLKAEQRLELWASNGARRWLVRSYPVLKASGTSGPKLRQGDGQVPEGVYRIAGLNPNSRYHLSLQLDYPNAFDRRQAQREGRTGLGGDIFIHGKAVSIGCLAMGDAAIEELFVLVSRVGKDRVSVLLAPRDFRRAPAVADPALPAWVNELYAALDRELRRYPR